MKLSDLNIRDFGHTIQIVGVVFAKGDSRFVAALPNEDVKASSMAVLELDIKDWASVLYQTDILEVEMLAPTKAVVRKSQRQIDTSISWSVYKRDAYVCRYCGTDGALTVDHIDLWEMGGASVEDNLVACCRKCNRLRGSMLYPDWLLSQEYIQRSARLTARQQEANQALIAEIPRLVKLRQKTQRSR